MKKPPLKSKKVFVVEDDASIREALQLVFSAEGYDVDIDGNGRRILNESIEVPDLFILDKNISGVSGLDICRFIRNNDLFKEVPVIMLSASPDIQMLALNAGANEAIVKPFSLKQIREIIAKYI